MCFKYMIARKYSRTHKIKSKQQIKKIQQLYVSFLHHSCCNISVLVFVRNYPARLSLSKGAYDITNVIDNKGKNENYHQKL